MKQIFQNIAFFILAILFIYSVMQISKELKEGSNERVKRERMQFLRDSLTVETLKKKLHEKKDTSEYSNDKIVPEDMGFPIDKSN